MQAQVKDVIEDVDGFAQLHKVQDKRTKRPIPWKSAPMQKKIFDAVKAGKKRIACIKARQVYATTGCKMVLHWMAATTPYAAMHAVVSMRDDSASMLLDDCRRWLDDVPELLKRPIATKAKSQIKYADTGASLRSFTSRSSTGLRSFTPAAAIISEAAFAPDLEEVVAQADAAVGDGLLIVESTVNNPGDFFSSLVREAPDNGWHLLHLWWWEHPAYEDEPGAMFDPAEFEETLTEE